MGSRKMFAYDTIEHMIGYDDMNLKIVVRVA